MSKKILQYILSGIICITEACKKYKKLHPQNNVAVVFILRKNIYI